MSSNVKTAFANAVPFLKVMGDVIMAWMLLWRAVVAAPGLEKLVGDLQGEDRLGKIAKNKNAAYYEGQIKTAEYFIQNVLPVTMGKMDSIVKGNGSVVDIPEASFGGE